MRQEITLVNFKNNDGGFFECNDFIKKSFHIDLFQQVQ